MNHIKFIEDDLYFYGFRLHSERELHELTNFGNSIWLPKVIVNKNYDANGNCTVLKTIKVLKTEINPKIEDSFFTAFISDDAYMLDGVREVVYRQRDKNSIGDILKDATKSKRVMILRYISVFVGLALIVIAFVMKYRVYHANKS